MTGDEIDAAIRGGVLSTGNTITAHLTSSMSVEGDLHHLVRGPDSTVYGLVLHTAKAKNSLFVPRSAITAVEFFSE